MASTGAAVLALVAVSPAGAVVGTGKKGPSTTVSPYVLPVADGVETTSLLTVGDMPATNGYKMVGIPDGLGLRNAGTAGKAELFMNHELRDTQGIVRAHGQKGAFVSDYAIDKTTLAVDSGKDLIDAPAKVTYYNYPAGAFSPTPSPAMAPFLAQPAAFQRFCSATLTQPGGLLNPISGNGFTGQIYFGNGRPVRRGASSASSRTARRSSCRASASSLGRTRSRRTTSATRRSSRDRMTQLPARSGATSEPRRTPATPSRRPV